MLTTREDVSFVFRDLVGAQVYKTKYGRDDNYKTSNSFIRLVRADLAGDRRNRDH